MSELLNPKHTLLAYTRRRIYGIMSGNHWLAIKWLADKTNFLWKALPWTLFWLRFQCLLTVACFIYCFLVDLILLTAEDKKRNDLQLHAFLKCSLVQSNTVTVNRETLKQQGFRNKRKKGIIGNSIFIYFTFIFSFKTMTVRSLFLFRL